MCRPGVDFPLPAGYAVGRAGQFTISFTGTFVNLANVSITPSSYLVCVMDKVLKIDRQTISIEPNIITPQVIASAANAPVVGNTSKMRIPNLAGGGLHSGGSFWDSLKNVASTIANGVKSVVNSDIGQAVIPIARRYLGVGAQQGGARRMKRRKFGSGFVDYASSEKRGGSLLMEEGSDSETDKRPTKRRILDSLDDVVMH